MNAKEEAINVIDMSDIRAALDSRDEKHKIDEEV